MAMFRRRHNGNAGWEMTVFGVRVFRAHSAWLADHRSATNRPRARRWSIGKD